MIKYFLEFPIFYLLIITLCYFDEKPILSLVCYVALFFLILFFPTTIFEEDRKDGNLGLLLTTFKPISIIIAKFCVKSTISLASMVICAIITYYFWPPDYNNTSNDLFWEPLEMLLLMLYVSIFANAISILLGSIYTTFTFKERIIIYPVMFVIITTLIIISIHLVVTLNSLLLGSNDNLDCNCDGLIGFFSFPMVAIYLIFNIAMTICTLYAASLIIPGYLDRSADDN